MTPVVQQATNRLNKCAQDLLTHAQSVESGLGDTPLQDHVQRLAQPVLALNAQGLTVVLLGLTSNAVTKTLSQWLGGDYFSCRALIPTQSPCFEIIARAGDGWEYHAGTSRSMYESLSTLAPAVEAAQQAAPGQEYPKIIVPAPPGCEGLRVLVPASLNLLRTHGTLASWLGDQAMLILVAGHSDESMGVEGLEALQPLSGAVGALRCISLSPPESGPPSWMQALQAAVTLPPMALLEAHPGCLTGNAVEMTVLRELSRLKGQEGAAHLIIDALGSESTTVLIKKRNEDPTRAAGLAAAGPMDNNPRGLSEKVMKPFVQELEEIRRNRDEEAARAIGPEGPLYQAVQELVDGTAFDDLRQETLNQTIRLSLSTATLERLRHMVRRTLHANLKDDLEVVNEAVQAGVDELNASLSGRTGFTHKIHLPNPDAQRLSDSLAALVQFNIRYKGEIPRATWRTRMQGARNWMMNISMFLMLSGGLAGVLTFFGMDRSGTQATMRNFLMVLMFFAFFVGLFATVFGFKKVRAEAVEREMDKLRDAVMQELSRLFQNLMNEKRRLLSDHLQRVQKDIEAEVAQIFQSQSESVRQDVERTRATAMEKTRILDARQRTLQQSQGSCRQVLAELSAIQLVLAQSVLEVARPVAAAVAGQGRAPAASAAPQRPAMPPPSRPASSGVHSMPSFTPPSANPSPLEGFVPPTAVPQSYS
jgi:hypothetical protein